MTVAIIDYGLGNVKALANVYERLNIPAIIAARAEDLRKAQKIILPGVGAFDQAMQLLDGSGLRGLLDDLVLRCKIPVLGICVGMQILARSSEEGRLPGLGWIEGDVIKFHSSPQTGVIRVPHMGWNNITVTRKSGLFRGLGEDSLFYFLHSYYFQCDVDDNVIARAHYGIEFTCAVNSGNVFGVQFHPEKSHRYGIQLLRNFAEL